MLPKFGLRTMMSHAGGIRVHVHTISRFLPTPTIQYQQAEAIVELRKSRPRLMVKLVDRFGGTSHFD
jgi:hypothetical protein